MSFLCWLAFLTANACFYVSAQDGPLPLGGVSAGGDFADGQVSARRQRLVELLAELIERHGPLGVWTHLDDDSPVARGGDRRSSASWTGRDEAWAGASGAGGFDAKASVSPRKSASSRKASGGPAFRVDVEDDESNFYYTSDDSTGSGQVRAGAARARDSETSKMLPGLYREPPPSSRGTKGPSRKNVGGRRGDDDGPISITSDRDRARDRPNKDTTERRGGGRKRVGTPRVTARRRDGVSVGDTPLQPGEDCDDDDRIIPDHGSETFPETAEVTENPSRPTTTRKQKGVKKPTTTTVRPKVKYPSDMLLPPYTPAYPTSTVYTTTSEPTTASNFDGNKVVNLLIKSWQEETRERRQKMVFQTSFSGGEYDVNDEADDDEVVSERIPDTPRWRSSFKLSGVLSAAIAGYNETYTMWYNGDTGEWRLDLNGGTATSLRLRTPNGSYQLLSTERMDLPEGSKRMCRMGTGLVLSGRETSPPALPDMKAFKFAGWLGAVERSEVGASAGDRRVERWQRVIRVKERSPESQPDGEEQLIYRHEMIVARRPYAVVPLRYTVTVDSSILGAASDIYMHEYHEFEEITPPQEQFNYDFDSQCDVHEEANISDPEHRAALEPLREFTEESRGPLYSVSLVRYKTRFVRQYYNYNEDVLRKNILMQKSRLVASVNRRGETFTLEINFLADRLHAELAQLFGAEPFQHGGSIAPPVPFPYDRATLRRRARKLPRAFDWREKGAINPVEFQGVQCMSCWAFAVVGAIEGGLFARTGRKLALSKQCLVDCGHKTDARGCNGTWPKYAYEYVRRHGLPTNSSYRPYIAEKRTCRAMGLSPLVYIGGHVDVTDHSVNALKISIYENGPVVVLIDSKSDYFQVYNNGVLGDPECGKRAADTNHAVLAVGWGEHKGKTYFILKNSWSEAWGEAGYVKMYGTNNVCGILTQPSYPLLPRLEEETVAETSAEDDYNVR